MPNTAKAFYALLLAGAVAAPSQPAKAACEAKSGDATVALLELYTSEGCSSCPPADRWVAELPKKGFDKHRVVPLAFHVDYWNYLGWTDPFSNGDFTRRQREFARRTNAATVYTPELLLNGREYRRWWGNNFERAVESVNHTPARADIDLKLDRSGRSLHVEGRASVRERGANLASLYVALYESNLSNRIGAGENSGRTLKHAFVVRRLFGPLAVNDDGVATFSKNLALEDGWKAKDLGVAAFVQEARDSQILQTLALDVCN